MNFRYLEKNEIEFMDNKIILTPVWKLHEILEICHTSTNGFSQFVIFCRDSLRWIKPRVLKNVTWLTCRWTDTKIPPTSTSKLRHKMGLQVGNISIIIKKILKKSWSQYFEFSLSIYWCCPLAEKFFDFPPIKIVSFVTLFLHQSACHSSTLKNSLFLSFKTRI